MKKFILGKKVGMTQVFDENGIVIPVTVIQAGPCAVVQKKTVENDGYTAVRLGYEEVPEKRVNKPEKGLFTKVNVTPRRYLREFRTDDVDSFEVGQEINVADMFSSGDKIDGGTSISFRGHERFDQRSRTHGSNITEESDPWAQVKPGEGIKKSCLPWAD